MIIKIIGKRMTPKVTEYCGVKINMIIYYTFLDKNVAGLAVASKWVNGSCCHYGDINIGQEYEMREHNKYVNSLRAVETTQNVEEQTNEED